MPTPKKNSDASNVNLNSVREVRVMRGVGPILSISSGRSGATLLHAAF